MFNKHVNKGWNNYVITQLFSSVQNLTVALTEKSGLKYIIADHRSGMAQFKISKLAK